MAAAYRTSAVGGSSSGTGNRTVAITPAVGDLLVVYCIVAANTNDAPTCSDNNGAGTYDLINVMNANIAGIDYRMSVFIRTALMANTTSTTITVATGSNTSGAVHAIAVSGMSRTGSNAVRSKGSQNNQAAGTAAPVLNQNALTGNMTIVAHGSADTTTTAPTNWTERQDTNFSNDTVALETATRDSGFTGSTITFGAASSTVFCSHALELDNSALFTRTAAIDGAGAIATAATFFTIFARSSALDGAGAVVVVGRRDLLRASVINATGAVLTSAAFFSVFTSTALINSTGAVLSSGTRVVSRNVVIHGAGAVESTGIFFTVFNGSALLDGIGSVVSSGARVASRSAAIDGTATIATTATFFTTFNGTASLDAVGAVASSAIFFSVFEGGAALDASGSIETSSLFFSISSGSTLIDGTGAVSSNGEIQSQSGEHQRSAALDASGQITSSGIAILERSSSFTVTAAVATSAISFSVFQGSASLSCDGLIMAVGRRELLRNASVDAAGEIGASATFFTTLESSSALSVTVTVESSGVVGAKEFERSILIQATSSIITSGIGIHVVTFRPREVLGIGNETRRVTVSREDRLRLVEAEQQTNVL